MLPLSLFPARSNPHSIRSSLVFEVSLPSHSFDQYCRFWQLLQGSMELRLMIHRKHSPSCSCFGRVLVLLLIFYWVLGSCWYFYYYPQLNDTTFILKFVWWSFLSRFLLLAISFTISPCSLLLLHFCAMVYYTLIHQVCQVMSYISFQVLIQVIIILLLLVTLLHWRLTNMQYIALPCAPMFISIIIISFQVKSFNDGILLIDPVMSSTCAMCTIFY